MPTDLPVLALIALAATVVAVAVLRRTVDHEASGGRAPSQAHRPGILAGAADVVDASIGMYLLRRMLGRPTTTRAEGRAERSRVALAAAEEDARRASLTGRAAVAPTRLVVAGTAAHHAPGELRDRQAHPLTVAPSLPVWRRATAMPRQGALAAGLVAVFIVAFGVAFAFWPRPAGGVLSATGTPAPSPTSDVSSPPTPTDSPTTSAPSVEPTAVLTSTPSPTTTPTTGATATPTAAPTATPAATRTPRPTARPTNTPRPTVSPTPTPTPTVGPTPSPTPEPTATPTPEPTATPTPEPTPDPTPEPTPAPTPDPTPVP